MPRLFLVLVFALFAAVTARSARPPNVIFILADDLGWTDITSFGSDLYRTPNVDRLVREGMKFDNAYSACTVCSPTRAAVMTGQYPARLHLTDWIAGHNRPFAPLRIPQWTQHLDTSAYTLAEALHDKGYVTGHYGKWHLGEEEKYWPENQGFDRNVGGWSKGSPNKGKSSDGYFSPYGNPRLKDGPKGEYLTDRQGGDASAFIEENHEKPFFLNLWFYAVHTPLQAPEQRIADSQRLIKKGGRQQNPTYAAIVESMDMAIGKVLETLDRLKLAENTIVIFTSDNGGLIGNRGDTTAAPKVTNNFPLREGKGSPYEGGVRVPLVVRLPKRIAAGSVSHVPVISTDYYPTVLGLTDTAPKSQQFDGVDFSSVLLGKSKSLNRPAIFWHYPHYHAEGGIPYGAIRKGDWKLIEKFEDNRLELYNLSKDIGEKSDLASVETKKRDELLGELRTWRSSVGAQMPDANPNYDPKKSQQKLGSEN